VLRPGKVYWAERYAAEKGVDLSRSYFYTDSYTDLPLLLRVGHPVAVNPDLRLRRLARRRGMAHRALLLKARRNALPRRLRESGGLFDRRRPTVGRRLSRRLKSAFRGAARRASAFADAKGILRSAQADRRPEALRRLKSAFQGAARRASAFADAKGILRSAQADHRPKALRRLKSAFRGAARRASAFADAKGDSSVGAGRPSAEGLWRPNSFGVQADRGPKASRGRIHSTRTPSWPEAS
jgi:hypothetical protein